MITVLQLVGSGSQRNPTILLSDISQIFTFIDGETLALAVKGIVLLILLLYVVFAFAAFIQIRRLQSWLMSLEPYRFPRQALIHLGLAAVGWLLALLAL